MYYRSNKRFLFFQVLYICCKWLYSLMCLSYLMIFSSTLPHLLYIKPVLNTAKCTLGLISVYDSENFNQALTSQVPMMPHIKNKVSPEATQVGESVNCELVWVFLPILLFLFFIKDPYSPEGPGKRLMFSPTRAYFDPFTPLGSSCVEPSCKSTHALVNVYVISYTYTSNLLNLLSLDKV